MYSRHVKRVFFFFIMIIVGFVYASEDTRAIGDGCAQVACRLCLETGIVTHRAILLLAL